MALALALVALGAVVLGAGIGLGGTSARGQDGATASSREPQPGVPWSQQKSGIEFVAPSTIARQNDLTVNPGMLWVDQGKDLWVKPTGAAGKSCASCHGALASMKGVATRYPAWDKVATKLYSLETRIQNCRLVNQRGDALQAEADDLIALTAAVAHQSRGLPLAPSIEGAERAPFDAARSLYNARIGQLNLSCANCHEQHWGKKLYSETVSQGQANGYPAYRLEWQQMGSLYRRLRGCFNSVRATPPMHGSPEHVGLELYLAWRAKGLAIETPAIRR